MLSIDKLGDSVVLTFADDLCRRDFDPLGLRFVGVFHAAVLTGAFGGRAILPVVDIVGAEFLLECAHRLRNKFVDLLYGLGKLLVQLRQLLFEADLFLRETRPHFF